MTGLGSFPLASMERGSTACAALVPLAAALTGTTADAPANAALCRKRRRDNSLCCTCFSFFESGKLFMRLALIFFVRSLQLNAGRIFNLRIRPTRVLSIQHHLPDFNRSHIERGTHAPGVLRDYQI